MIDDALDGGVLSGDQWEQTQYLPGSSVAQFTGPGDPKKKKAPTAPLTRILTGDEWEKARGLSGAAVKALQIPTLPTIPAAPADGTQVGPGRTKGTPLAPFNAKDPTTYANPVLRQLVNPMLDNPIQTAVTVPFLGVRGVAGTAIATGMLGEIASNIARYGYQQHVASDLSPEARAELEADPERVTGEAAAMQALMVGLAPLIHVGVKSARAYEAGLPMEIRARNVDRTIDPNAAYLRGQAGPHLRPGDLSDMELPVGNNRFASELEQAAATTRIPTDVTHPEGFVPTAGGARLKTNPRAVEGLEVPASVTPGRVKALETDPASAPLEQRAALDASVREYVARTAEEDAAVLSEARRKAAEKVARADRFRPRRRVAGEKVDLLETEQGAEILGAQAARYGLPETASPFHPDDPRSLAWQEGHAAGTEATARAQRAVEHGASAVPEATPTATPEYPDGFSMGGALTDNRLPGAVELPKTARGSDVVVPEGATPETAALAAALKPSPFRAHTTDELATAALEAQRAIEEAQQAQAQAAYGKLSSERGQADMENRGVSISDEAEGTTATADRALARAKSRLSQIEREFALRGVSGDDLAQVMQGAKEMEAERLGLQSDEALAQHMGADDPFGEAPAPAPAPAAAEPAIDYSMFHVDEGIHSRLLNTKDGGSMGTVGYYLKSPKLRALYADVLDVPIIKLSSPPEGAPVHGEYKGAFGFFGENGDQPIITVAAQSRDEFIPTLLEEASHALRAQRGRLDEAQPVQDPNYSYEQYRNAPGEQSAEKMVKHALSLRDDAPATINSRVTDRSLIPVEGTGPTRTRGLSAGVEAKALANKLTMTVGELPEYKTLKMAEQAEQAMALLAEDPALARRVALGEAAPPDGLLAEVVFTAVENRAIAEGDVATLRELATGKLTSEATTMGQRIRALGERDPESPVGAIQKVVDGRAKAVKDSDAAMVKALASIEATAAKAKIPHEDLVAFINSLRC